MNHTIWINSNTRILFVPSLTNSVCVFVRSWPQMISKRFSGLRVIMTFMFGSNDAKDEFRTPYSRCMQQSLIFRSFLPNHKSIAVLPTKSSAEQRTNDISVLYETGFCFNLAIILVLPFLFRFFYEVDASLIEIRQDYQNPSSISEPLSWNLSLLMMIDNQLGVRWVWK